MTDDIREETHKYLEVLMDSWDAYVLGKTKDVIDLDTARDKIHGIYSKPREIDGKMYELKYVPKELPKPRDSITLNLDNRYWSVQEISRLAQQDFKESLKEL